MTNRLLVRIDPEKLAVVQKHTAEKPVRVGDLAVELGLRVTRSPLPPSISGLIKPTSVTSSGFEVVVNKFEPLERQRFTVAHEIAHYLLHRDEIGSGVTDTIMYRSSLSSRKEAEANQLAALIVMPPEAVEIELARLGGLHSPTVVEELAEQFRVSIPAMKVRLSLVA
jgi:IrrE N-terminal-like domain